MSGGWISPALAFLGGGAATHYLEKALGGTDSMLDHLRRSRTARQEYELSYRNFGLASEALYFYRIHIWNMKSPLIETNNMGPTVQVDRRIQPQNWINNHILDEYRRLAREQGGSPCPNLVKYQIDDDESGKQESFS